MILKNALVYTGDKTFRAGEIAVSGERFAEGAADGTVLDAQGCYAIPGLIDLHLHGCMGADFCDGTPGAIARIAEYELSAGVTAIAPATMTLPCADLERILSAAADYAKHPAGGAALLGVNMEGPFISPVKKGAQDARSIVPCSVEAARRFVEASDGLVRFIGLAPEENPDFAAFIGGVKDFAAVSLAHTNADYDTAMAAFAAGARHAVHLYNAMPPFTHRAPGVIGAVMDSPWVDAELICDGVHLHPSAVRAAFRMLGGDRIVFISDSMRATGMPDGRYTLGGLDVDVTGNRAVLAADGALAGSVTNLMDCLRTAVRGMGIPLEDAVACATINPARSLGVADRYGAICPGWQADLVLLDGSLNLKAVIQGGRIHRWEL